MRKLLLFAAMLASALTMSAQTDFTSAVTMTGTSSSSTDVTYNDETVSVTTTGWTKVGNGNGPGTYNYTVYDVNGRSAIMRETYGATNASHHIQQTLTGLPTGVYEVKVYGTSLMAWNGGSLSADANDVAYVYAIGGGTEKQTFFTAKVANNYSSDPAITTVSDINVTDGELTFGIGSAKSGQTNWITINIYSLTRTGDLATMTLAEDVSSYDGTIPTAAYETLKSTVASNNGDYTDVDEYNTAKDAIAAAKAAADALVSPYAAAKAMLEAVSAIDDDASAYTDESSAADALQSTISSTDIESMTTADDLNNAVSTLKAAATTFLGAVTINSDIEITDIYVTNPSFETGDATGWTITAGDDAGVYPNTNGTYTIDPIDGDYLANAWQWSSGTVSMYHDAITDLPNGTYNITAALASFENRDLVMSATGKAEVTTSYNTSSNPKGTAIDVSVKNVTVEGSLTFGVSATYSDTQPFVKSDNWRLYITAGVSEEDAAALLASVPEGKMNADVQTALNEAKEAFEAEQSSAEKYAALSAAITAANTSIAAYASLKETTDAMKVEMDNTNIYTEEAYNTFNSQYETWVAAYEAGTISDEEAAAAKEATFGKGTNDGWHATVTVDDFLLSAWTIGGEQCNEFDKSLYINTWSVEGNNSGKMVVPFFEYWTGDANTLGTNTMVGSVSGLEAGLYKVTLQARVRLTNNSEDTPTGITANLNDGADVDLCAGTVVDENQPRLYWGEFEVQGVVGEDGTLKLNIEVAEGNNISWLAFKYAKYEYVGAATITREYGYTMGTICYPYVLTPAEGTSIYTIKGYDATNKKVVLGETVSETEAGKPYVYEATEKNDAGNYVATFNYTTSGSADEEVASDNFKGTFAGGAIFADQSTDNTIHIVQKGKWVKVPSTYWSSYEMTANTAYIVNIANMTAAESSSSVKTMNVEFDDATGIESINADVLGAEGAIYNVAGQKVDSNYKGIVIVNGKKYLNK